MFTSGCKPGLLFGAEQVLSAAVSFFRGFSSKKVQWGAAKTETEEKSGTKLWAVKPKQHAKKC